MKLFPLAKVEQLHLLLLFLATVAVYAVTFGHAFIDWDDYDYVVNNGAVQGLTLEHLQTVFTHVFMGNYAPVNMISYMLDYALWGLNPTGYHLDSVLIHAGNGMLVYLVMRRLLLTPTSALLAAAIFLFHPLQAESVAWVAERKNLLGMLFFLATLLSYCSWRENPASNKLMYLISLGMFLLAVLSKSVTVIFPAAAILLDLCYHREAERRFRFVDKIPYVLIATAAVFMTFLSQSRQMGGGIRDYPGGSLVTTACTMMPVLWSYLKECLWPVDLLPYYMVNVRQCMDAEVISAEVVMAGLVALGVILWRYQRQAFFFYAFFFIALLPVSQVVPLITLKNDRYLYFPLLGFAGLAATLFAFLWQRFANQRGLVMVMTFMLLAPLPVLTIRQAEIWKDELTLWGYTVERDPENRLAWLMLARAYTLRGDAPDALTARATYRSLRDRYGPVRGWEDN
jgi:hypothetical protein